MGRAPWILVASPLQASQEENHTRDRQQATDKINLTDDFAPGESSRIWSRRGEIEGQSANKSYTSPQSAKKSAISPASMRSNQLTPKNGWTKRKDGEDKDGNVLSSFASRGELSSDSQRCELADASANARKGHANCHEVRNGQRCISRLGLLPIKTSMVFAVPQMIMAMTSNAEPPNATHRLPIRSDMEPTKGHMAARASR